jgi:hypothetical protein
MLDDSASWLSSARVGFLPKKEGCFAPTQLQAFVVRCLGTSLLATTYSKTNKRDRAQLSSAFQSCTTERRTLAMKEGVVKIKTPPG